MNSTPLSKNQLSGFNPLCQINTQQKYTPRKIYLSPLNLSKPLSMIKEDSFQRFDSNPKLRELNERYQDTKDLFEQKNYLLKNNKNNINLLNILLERNTFKKGSSSKFEAPLINNSCFDNNEKNLSKDQIESFSSEVVLVPEDDVDIIEKRQEDSAVNTTDNNFKRPKLLRAETLGPEEINNRFGNINVNLESEDNDDNFWNF